MATIERSANAVWNGTITQGAGQLDTDSGTMNHLGYSFATRFQQAAGTNPEELLAAAHAACYSMSLAYALGHSDYEPQLIQTRVICFLAARETNGYAITKLELNVQGKVPNIDADTFRVIAEHAEAACPISNAVRGSVSIELKATLV
jgi:osmotically inducible protein OsmC